MTGRDRTQPGGIEASTQRSAVLPKIANALPAGRDDCINWNPLAYAQLLVIAKEKRPVFLDWAANAAAELVLAKLRFWQLRPSEIVVLVRIQRLVPEEFEQGAMEHVGARFREDIHDARGGAANFGAIQIRLNLELLDRVNRRPDTDRADESLIVVHAVDQIIIRHRILAIYGVGRVQAPVVGPRACGQAVSGPRTHARYQLR